MVKAQELKNVIMNIPRRTMKDAHERIIGDGSKLAGVMRRMTMEAQKRPRDALAKWKNYLQMCKEKGILDRVKAQQL